jgi:hypothetical protein
MFQTRNEYSKCEKAYEYTKLKKDGSISVRLNQQYRLVFHWKIFNVTSSSKWSRDEITDKYLKAIVVSSDRQND